MNETIDMGAQLAGTVELQPAQAMPVSTHHQATAVVNPSQLLAIAVERGANVEQLERLMALQIQWDQHQLVLAKVDAEKAFNAAIASFRSAAPRAVRNVQVKDGPLKGKSYVDLSGVVDAVTEALSARGLSATWAVTKDERDWIEVTCTIKHVLGHSESVSFGGAPDTGPGRNALQARKSTVTYLERITLLLATGVAESDADDDGAGGAPAEITGNVLQGLLAELAKAADDKACVVLWGSGKKTLAALGDRTAYDEFKYQVEQRRVALKAAQQ